MTKHAIFAGLGNYYGDSLTGYSSLPFVYQNIKDLTEFLRLAGWKPYVPMIDPAAGKDDIVKMLNSTIQSLQPDDWLLFYYTGHGNKYFVDPPINGETVKTYCVTYNALHKYDSLPALDTFFTEIDYDKIVEDFHKTAPNGHLITILDCCYAFGMVDKFSLQKDYHTVIAASSEFSKAFYRDNSFFFSALKKSWDATSFSLLKQNIESEMRRSYAANKCAIELAGKFLNSSLKQLI